MSSYICDISTIVDMDMGSIGRLGEVLGPNEVLADAVDVPMPLIPSPEDDISAPERRGRLPRSLL